jgi:tetratricopeptide (TPR) repeat protein
MSLPAMAIALSLAACSASPEERLDNGRSALAAGDYGAAKAELVEGLHDEPENARLLHLLGLAQIRMQDPEGTLKTVAMLRKLGNTGPAVTRLEAEALLLSGNIRKALDVLGRDDSADAWRIRAACYSAKGRTGEALKAFERAMAAGNDPRLGAEFAHFLLTTQDFEGATKVQARMQEYAPGAFETIMVAGDLAAYSGHDEAALKRYQQAGTAFPARYEALTAQAGALERLGWLDEAIEKVEEAAAIAPASSNIDDLRLRMLATKGDWPRIREILQPDEGKLDPVSMRGMTYGEALLRVGQAEQARALFQRTVLLAPENRYARTMLGEAQLATGDARAAYRTLEPLTYTVLLHRTELELVAKAAREANTPDAVALQARLDSPEYRRLTRLAETGEQALVERNWKKALATYLAVPGYNEDPDVLLRLAMASNNLGDTGAARDYADRALELAPNAGETLHMAGLVRLTAGQDLARAVELLRGAVTREPGNPEFKANLAKAEAAAG